MNSLKDDKIKMLTERIADLVQQVGFLSIVKDIISWIKKEEKEKDLDI